MNTPHSYRKLYTWITAAGLLGALLLPGAAAQAQWVVDVGSPGPDNTVLCLQPYDVGNGPELFGGGAFVNAATATANHLARWNGTNWSAVGSGVDADVRDMIPFDDGSGQALYICGNFSNAGAIPVNHIARWRPGTFSPLGTGLDGNVAAMAIYDDGTGPALYAGGSFPTAGVVTVNNIAKWNGATWSPLGAGVNQPVTSLAVFDDGNGPVLFVGGMFDQAGGSPANRIAKYNGTTGWSPVGAGMNQDVFALTVFDDGTGRALFAGGLFNQAGGAPAPGVARWNGVQWAPVGTGLTAGVVLTLNVNDEFEGPLLYAGGAFNQIGGVVANNIGKWDGAAWSPLSTGANQPVQAVEGFDLGQGPGLFAGGAFSAVGLQPTQRMARWQPPVVNTRTTIKNALHLDVDRSQSVNAGDQVVLTFNNRIGFVQTTISPTTFFLPIPGDNLGPGATMARSPFNPRQVIITLGAGAQIQVLGQFNSAIVVPGSPSGIDIHAAMTGSIRDEFNADVEDLGTLNTNDTGRDVQNVQRPKPALIPAAAGGQVRPNSESFFSQNRLTIPAGALLSDTTLSLQSANLGNLSAVNIEPATALIAPVSLTLEYKPLDIDRIGGDIEEGARIRVYDPNTQTYSDLPGGQTVDKTARTITATVDTTGLPKPFAFFAGASPADLPLAKAGVHVIMASAYGNIGIPTIRAATVDISSQQKPSLLAAVTLLAGTDAVYTKHQLVINGYVAGASLSVQLQQATLLEKILRSFTKNCIAKIAASGETDQNDLLTLEYKDDDDDTYPTDVPNGSSEAEMQVFYYDEGATDWVQVPGAQSQDLFNNTVTAAIANIADASFYAVMPGVVVNSSSVAPAERAYR